MDQPPSPKDLLRLYLAESDALCPACGYNLRGLTTGACPECNMALAIHVSLADARLRPLVATLVGLAIGAGSASFLLVLFVVAWFQNSPGEIASGVAWLTIFLAGGLGEGVPLVLLARRRGRLWFLRKGPSVRRIVAAAWLATALWMAAVYLMIAVS